MVPSACLPEWPAIDSQWRRAYHSLLMRRTTTSHGNSYLPYGMRILLAVLSLSLLAPAVFAADPDIFPLSKVQPGMKGEAYTIFAGDQIEKFDLVVIGVMPNFLAPKESIILVQLLGAKVEHTGVVAGMSGSPVYFEGKLAGALSLKLGQFNKEPLAGITPIENILSLPKGQSGVTRADGSIPLPQDSDQLEAKFEIPSDWASRAGVSGGSFLTPIASPLVFSGFSAVAIRQFEHEFAAYGMAATQGGSIDARSSDGLLLCLIASDGLFETPQLGSQEEPAFGSRDEALDGADCRGRPLPAPASLCRTSCRHPSPRRGLVGSLANPARGKEQSERSRDEPLIHRMHWTSGKK